MKSKFLASLYDKAFAATTAKHILANGNYTKDTLEAYYSALVCSVYFLDLDLTQKQKNHLRKIYLSLTLDGSLEQGICTKMHDVDEDSREQQWQELTSHFTDNLIKEMFLRDMRALYMEKGPMTEDEETMLYIITQQLFPEGNAPLIITAKDLMDAEQMVFVRAGEFMMGAKKDCEGCKVTLTQDYLIGKYPVTQGQWYAVMGSTRSTFGDDNMPVGRISWDDAVAYCNKLNEKYEGLLPAGYKFDLPTDAQWEYAAQGGNRCTTRTAYSGSDNIADVAVYGREKENGPLPVGQRAPNELGIYDMSGNIREWCADYVGVGYLREKGINVDPFNDLSYRTTHGGSWRCKEERCEITRIDSPSQIGHEPDIGFRIALVPIRKQVTEKTETTTKR